MLWHPSLNQLRDALADLYPDGEDARRLAATATLAVSHIVLQGKAINIWQSIVEEAEKAQQVEALIAAATSEYPQNEALRAAVQAYRRWVAQGQPSPSASVSVEPVLLDLVDFKMPLVRVPEGEFRMGSTNHESGLPSERPAHKLSLPAYLIGRYPVTVAQYRVFVRSGHRQPHTPDSLRGPDDHPVAHVTWYEALAFCRWASQVSGRPVQLPSEAEWEKAARCRYG